MYIKCQNCGKLLTDPESRQRGYGPECWQKVTGRPQMKTKEMESEDIIPGQMNIFDFPEYLPEQEDAYGG